jgi:hypothetical protein
LLLCEIGETGIDGGIEPGIGFGLGSGCRADHHYR